MNNTPIFDEDYKGQRWTYGFNSRPIGFAHQPKGYIIHSDREHPNYRYGTLDWPRELTPDEIYSFELLDVAAETAAELKQKLGDAAPELDPEQL